MTKLARPNDLTVFTAPACVQCKVTKKAVDRLGLRARYIDISVSTTAAEELRAAGFARLPVIFPNDNGMKPWAGFSQSRLETLARRCRTAAA